MIERDEAAELAARSFLLGRYREKDKDDDDDETEERERDRNWPEFAFILGLFSVLCVFVEPCLSRKRGTGRLFLSLSLALSGLKSLPAGIGESLVVPVQPRYLNEAPLQVAREKRIASSRFPSLYLYIKTRAATPFFPLFQFLFLLQLLLLCVHRERKSQRERASSTGVLINQQTSLLSL